MSIRFDIIFFAIGLSLITYLFGAYSAEKKWPTYPRALEEMFATRTVQFERNPKFWQEADFTETGVVEKSGEAVEGLTFYLSADRQGAKLIDMAGETVHEWQMRFRDVWADPRHVDEPVAADKIRWRYAHLYPNGDVLAVFEARGAVPHGYGLAKINADSEVIWKLGRRIHHQVEVTDEGTIYAVEQIYRDLERSPIPNQPQIKAKEGSEILEDVIVEVGPNGWEGDRIRVLDAIIESPFRDILETFPSRSHRELYNERAWDPAHVNDVEVANAAVAETVPAVDAGDLLVSIRPLQAIVAIDPATHRAVWASRGIWTRQHDPDVLENGHLMVFDNLGQAGPGGQSRILEINPRTNGVPWDYAGTAQAPFYSFTEGSQQRLENGNVLITEAQRGRLVEVSRQGGIVWQYNNPAVDERDGVRKVAQVQAAKRYRAEVLEFLGGGQ